MSLATGRYQLSSAFKTLETQWEAAQKNWRDSVREEFTREYWNEIDNRVGGLLSAIDRLDQIIAQIKHECGD